MTRPADSTRIAAILKRAPVWARLALSAPNEALVERAADTLGAIIADRLAIPESVQDDRQMMLPMS